MTEETTTTTTGTADVGSSAADTLATTTTDTATSGQEGTTTTTDGMTDVPVPEYQPNFKFKYLDAAENKQIEKEFDEWARGFIKDKKTEEAFRSLYCKSYGLDAATKSRERIKAEYEATKNEVAETKKALGVLSNYVQSGDMQSFFESLKIPEETVLKYAMERIQYREMTPQQRAEYDNIRSVKARNEYLAEQNAAMEQQYIQSQTQAREAELERTLADPNISAVAQAFDERMGEPGSFRNEVIRRGQYYWHQFQKDIPAEQAVNEVLKMFGGLPQTQTPAMQPTLQPAANQPAEKKPVIPNIQGSGKSPAKKSPRSIEDLKKLGQALA